MQEGGKKGRMSEGVEIANRHAWVKGRGGLKGGKKNGLLRFKWEIGLGRVYFSKRPRFWSH